MGLTTVLSSALSGLRATQSSLEVVAGNVANAETPGYTRKSLGLTPALAGTKVVGVSAGLIQRQLDLQVQVQHRTQSSVGEFTRLHADFAGRLDVLFGTPGGPSSLDTLLANLTGALEALATTPDSRVAQIDVLSNAATLAGQLNSLTEQVQAMRQEAETGIAEGVRAANDALANIKRLNDQIQAESASGGAPAQLMDQRDGYIAELASLIDIRVSPGPSGTVAISTGSGFSLLGGVAATLDFDAAAGVTAEMNWSGNPADRELGTLRLRAGGQPIDLFAGGGALNSGAIAAYRELRDTVLVEAQAQLDALAAQMSLALSNETVAGGSASVPPAAGFDLDLADLKAGNAITLDYVETPGGATHRITFLRVENGAALPLADTATADPTDAVFGIDFSGGMASVAAQIQTALGGNFAVSNAGNTLRILDDGAGGAVDVTGLSASVTVGGLDDGGLGLPFFVDGVSGKLFSASLEGNGQTAGFAGRIRLNPALLADPTALVGYDAGVSIGDPARPVEILRRLTESAQAFRPETGLGSKARPFTGSIADFVGQVLALRGADAANAAGRNEAQEVVVNSLHERLAKSAGVNIDDEMAHLVELQSAYAANARVMTAVREMLDILMGI